MKKQAGFTLIELVIVIIILGILAVTAAPKFLNLQDDARKAAADGVKASLQSSAQMIYSKAAIQGIEASSVAVSVAGTNVEAIYGYPTANTIANAVTLDGWSEVSASKGTFKPQAAGNNANCQVKYNEASAAGGSYSVVVSGCTN
ncbi:prepilin-type N-terminal cleavage/methylation domain-containing protein [Aeromonas veronii]|uniref:prepilin-type N-terminal cleavage/methylation domain-containing protein n=1 Tax=Aeromonas veronii TaxID=654 RepID=UPI00366CA491